MTSQEIRQLFLDFFKEKKHTIVPSSSLLSDDPTVLLTTAGMQQFKPYYLGEKSPFGQRVASVQKCFRTSDIDSVGDESHLTFFEMLGNFSFGDYFKKEAIEYAYEFITQKLGLKIDFVSVFQEDDGSPKIWQKINPNLTIKKFGREDNFWGPTGNEGPCGPTTEIYVKNSEGKSIEIWNLVFNEYFKDPTGKFSKLKMPGVDTGMGLERLTMIVQNKPTIFETDLFEVLKKDKFGTPLLSEKLSERIKRIILDHSRGIAFLINDGLRPSNKESGYILRRLIRRVIVYEFLTGDPEANAERVLKAVIRNYPELQEKIILPVFQEENSRFLETVQSSLKELNKISSIDAPAAFRLYESYGLPYEIIKELAGVKAQNLTRENFDKEFQKHQEISRAGLEKKFGGHGLKEGGEITGVSEAEKEKIIKLHTATHLLHQALSDLFGEKIKQMGSDINPERLRFDFPMERKLTSEEINQLENIVNQKIQENLPVQFEEKSKDEAVKEGAKAFFKAKYPDRVKVYTIGNPSTGSGQVYSKEICNGPHVKNTAELGHFKILKEEAVGAGIRRIKATIV